ncbi:hypothetical protein H0W91_02080 [Patescibacteria group bacterium]|nr:hypothetical protein [Patescibacteria group bacterium]
MRQKTRDAVERIKERIGSTTSDEEAMERAISILDFLLQKRSDGYEIQIVKDHRVTAIDLEL